MPTKAEMVIRWKKDTTITGYEVNVSTNKKFPSSGATKGRMCGKSAEGTKVPSLKSGKTYYARVRSYTEVDGIKYYGDWSAVKTVKVK